MTKIEQIVNLLYEYECRLSDGYGYHTGEQGRTSEKTVLELATKLKKICDKND